MVSQSLVMVGAMDFRFSIFEQLHINRVMRKLDLSLCENTGEDQLCINCTADQRLCFCYTDSAFPLLLK